MSLSLAALVGLLLTPAAIARTEPTFGISTFPNSQGFGKVRPSRIYLGGDISGLVRHVRWNRWGGRRARGHGKGWYIPPGGFTASGHYARARIVAWDLGRCDGQRAYGKGEWFFPEYHRHGHYPEATYFSPRYAIDLCDD